jgi:hypothetical protein
LKTTQYLQCPLLTATIGAKYTMLDQKLLLGFKGIFAATEQRIPL